MASRYIDPTTDFGFKRLFGQEDSKAILKQFLFDMLGLKHPIEDLSYIPGEQLPAAPEDRISVYDVYCVDSAGQRFIVEMQRNRQVNFKERALYYSTFPIMQQAEKGWDWRFGLLPVYCIGMLNFAIDDEPRYLRRVQLIEHDTGRVFYQKLTFLFVELPKFNLALDQLTNARDKWIYLLRYLPALQDIPAELAQEPFTDAFHIAEQSALSPEERLLYNAALKRARDNYNIIATASEDGQKRARQAIARSLQARGFNDTEVSGITELTLEELAKLTDDAQQDAHG